MKISKDDVLSTAIATVGLTVALCTVQARGCRQGSKKTIDMLDRLGYELSDPNGNAVPLDTFNVKWRWKLPWKK